MGAPAAVVISIIALVKDTRRLAAVGALVVSLAALLLLWVLPIFGCYLL